MANEESIDTTSDNRNPNEVSETVQFWLNEIGAARKREKEFRREGKRIRDIYDGTSAEETPFNILFSNVETMAPALYSQVPRPVVQRRFKDADPLGKAAAVAGQRILEFMLDTNIDGYETFDESMKSVVMDALLPGRGVSAVKYDATIAEVDGAEVKTGELICCDSRSWDRVFFGYARKWSKVPWVAFEEHMDRDSATEMFGKETADRIQFTVGEDNDDDDGKQTNSSDERDTGERKTALVYQIWDKEDGRVVRYISPHYKEGYLKVQPDPLDLTGFFPIPRPIQFIEKSNDLNPVPPYRLYENQAKELNRLTRRINRIAEAIKARGIYDSSLGGDIENVMKADDNTLVPSDKSSSLAAEKGLQNAIWFLPLQELIITLEKLTQARELCKQVIYEITGISDIIRGSTKASETLGAQQLKSQWGTLRIKPKQAEVQRYARDILRLMLEIAATKFSEDTWAQMTGLPYATTQAVQQAQQIMQAAQQQMAQMQMMMQSGQPSQQPQVPPQIQQALQQAQQVLAQPKWQDVLGMLKKDTQRAYRIDIETNSTVEPEAVEDQKNIAELMTALGQFLNGVGPLVEKGVMPFEVAQTMMLSITRRFRFGSEIEDQVKAMKAPPPPPEDKGGQAEMAKVQAQTQLDQQKMQMQGQMDQAKMQMQSQMDQAKLQFEQQLAVERLASEERIASARMQAERSVAQMKAKIEQDTALKVATMQQMTAVETARIQAEASVKAAAERPQASVQ